MKALALPALVLLVSCVTLHAQESAIQIPENMSKYLGDPNRGSEPDPKQEKGQWKPPLDPVEISEGHPIKEYGHYRMKIDVVGKARGKTPFIIPVAAEDMKKAVDRFEVKKWKDGKTLLYSYMAPDSNAKAPKDGFPLVVYCPGSGGVRKKKLIAKGAKPYPELMWATDYYRENFPAYVIHPHPQGRTVSYKDDGVVESTPILQDYIDLIKATIKEHKDIDPKRVYVMGFSMGGSTTWKLILKEPDLFAAACPAAGGPPKDIDEVKKFKDVPIWMFMGNKDPWSGSSRYINIYQNLMKAGAKKVRFWEIQDMAHSPRPQSMLPVAEWMFEQKKEK